MCVCVCVWLIKIADIPRWIWQSQRPATSWSRPSCFWTGFDTIWRWSLQYRKLMTCAPFQFYMCIYIYIYIYTFYSRTFYVSIDFIHTFSILFLHTFCCNDKPMMRFCRCHGCDAIKYEFKHKYENINVNLHTNAHAQQVSFVLVGVAVFPPAVR